MVSCVDMVSRQHGSAWTGFAHPAEQTSKETIMPGILVPSSPGHEAVEYFMCEATVQQHFPSSNVGLYLSGNWWSGNKPGSRYLTWSHSRCYCTLADGKCSKSPRLCCCRCFQIQCWLSMSYCVDGRGSCTFLVTISVSPTKSKKYYTAAVRVECNSPSIVLNMLSDPAQLVFYYNMLWLSIAHTSKPMTYIMILLERFKDRIERMQFKTMHVHQGMPLWQLGHVLYETVRLGSVGCLQTKTCQRQRALAL